jgi:FkbM family methyltransferase
MTYYSQWKQDEYIYNSFFKNKTEPGVFLEIGADDGVRFSNCKFFEETHNWTGIAVEARKEAYNKLITNRTCNCVRAVLSDVIEDTKFMDIKGYGLGLSGLVNKYDPRHLNRIEQEIKNINNKGVSVIDVKTEKLNELLDKYNMTNIDFLSIDTEGSELAILKTLDFDKYNIDVITIEDNYKDEELMKFFISRNYSFLKQIECDKIFRKNQ